VILNLVGDFIDRLWCVPPVMSTRRESTFFTSYTVFGSSLVLLASFAERGSISLVILPVGSAYVFAAAETPSDAPPTITLKAPISLWPPNHKYQAVIISQMVQSASDAEDGDLINSVGIEKSPVCLLFARANNPKCRHEWNRCS
jgi:hypothetical protein